MNQFYMLFDDAGELAARYTTEIHGTSIPKEALKVSEESFLKSMSGRTKVVDGKVVIEVIDTAKILKKEEIRGLCQHHIVSGFVSKALGAEFLYPLNNQDQINLNSAVACSTTDVPEDWSTSIWCCSASGNWSLQAHNKKQVQQLGVEARAFINESLIKCAQLVSQVESSDNFSSINR